MVRYAESGTVGEWGYILLGWSQAARMMRLVRLVRLARLAKLLNLKKLIQTLYELLKHVGVNRLQVRQP
eukprot:COSAG01_NODE_5035_length_4533_cov_1.888814_7_plen_69_part_00